MKCRFVVVIRYHDAGDCSDTILVTEKETSERANLFIEQFKEDCPKWRTIRYTQVNDTKKNDELKEDG